MNSIQLLFDIILFKENKELSLLETQVTFKAFVDASIPLNHELDLNTEQFLISMLDHLLSLSIAKKNVHIPIANITSEMLNKAATVLISREENKELIDTAIVREKSVFASLHPSDRLRAISILEEVRLDLANLPIPFWKNCGFVIAIISVLTLLTTFGYYSEWSGYESTRSNSPEKRVLEKFPSIWQKVGYPGPSKGYHAFRGYLE